MNLRNTVKKLMSLNVNLEEKRSRSYKILIGYNILDHIAGMIADSKIALHYVIVTDDHVCPLYGKALLAELKKKSIKSDMIVFPAGEKSKNFQSVIKLASKLIDLGTDRKSALIALGGGVVGDMTGFIASLYMRGLPWIQVPTTLLAQVDSSIGGKTAINLAQGKNLLGTFYQPAGVFIDIKCLDTLPVNEYQNGLAEIVKYGIFDGEALFHKLEGGVDIIRAKNGPFLEEIISTACRIKKDIVEMDETEKGQRRILNLGHTLGHALEKASGYRLSHGNAIAIGMIAVARLSQKILGLPEEDRDRIERLLVSLCQDCLIPKYLETEDILAALQRDKKKKGDTIYFVMLKKIGSPIIRGDIPNAVLRDTIEELKA